MITIPNDIEAEVMSAVESAVQGFELYKIPIRTIEYRTDNLLLEQVMEAVVKIIDAKGPLYLLTRLEASIKQLKI